MQIDSNSGSLQVQINDESIGMPIPNTKVLIQDESNKIIEELITDESGQTPIINLAAPKIDYSLDQNNTEVRPYSVYNIQAIIKGYKTKIINGTQILSNTMAIQEINLERDLDNNNNNNQDDNIFISANTLWGEFEPKIPEDSVKPLNNPTGEVVLNKVVIPEYIVVHDGVPSDSSAKNYYILFNSNIFWQI